MSSPTTFCRFLGQRLALRRVLAGNSVAFSRCLSLDIRQRVHLEDEALPAWTEIYTTEAIDPFEPTFDKILIANRGEIACRVIRTARRMGIKTVAIHSDVDSNSLHVRLADESVCVGPANSALSYLNMDAIVAACLKTGAQAVHPGYGFLSENTNFAGRLEKEGITFIGPSSSAIIQMGDKLESKRIANLAKVNCIPGFDGEITDVDHCLSIAKELGYPIMMKASAGGGGKGMRVAWTEAEARDGFKLSRDEAKASFGDDRMLVEKFVAEPRHIEIQLLADKHGNAVYLNERECSIQRRNQKVIEEAPSPFLDGDTRKAMGNQAVALARAVGYSSAGTVEFLVDRDKNFYFLEMNTRLQVEHPITECITGLDIVHQMIRVAKGHALKIKQEDVPIRGWAIESRVYAEDPFKKFGTPSVGRLSKYQEPEFPGVRCDSGVTEGSEISVYYDPMICKLVTYGKTRQEAIDKQVTALDEYVIRGVTHNIPLLRTIMTEQRYLDGKTTTNYLPEVFPDGFNGREMTQTDTRHLQAIAACIQCMLDRRAKQCISGHKFLRPIATEYDYVVRIGTSTVPVHLWSINPEEGVFSARVGKVALPIRVECENTLADAVMKFNLDGREESIQVIHRKVTGHMQVRFLGCPFDLRCLPAHVEEVMHFMPIKLKGADTKNLVVSPMPGQVKAISCSVGDVVAEHQEVCVIEAMKMQNALLAPFAAKVTAIEAKVGETVDEGQIIVQLAPLE